jgi:mono/diheme cytochrome c family protein
MTRRQVVPPLLLVTVTLATFGLAKWHPFSPSAAPAASVAGDAIHGREVFVVNCSGCHGMDATGGIGPSLHGLGLTVAAVEEIVASGRGVMPAGVVQGQDAADVAAYVAGIGQ